MSDIILSQSMPTKELSTLLRVGYTMPVAWVNLNLENGANEALGNYNGGCDMSNNHTVSNALLARDYHYDNLREIKGNHSSAIRYYRIDKDPMWLDIARSYRADFHRRRNYVNLVVQ